MGFSRQASGSSLALVLAMAAIGIGIIGWELPAASCPKFPASPCWTHVENGSFTCTTSSASVCTSSQINFSPGYTSTPNVWVGWDSTTGNPSASSTVTTTTIVNLGVEFQAVNNTNWRNIPVSYTELYGHANQRVFKQTPTSFSSQSANFCIDVSNSTNIGAPDFKPQYSTDLSTWHDFSGTLDIGPSGLGMSCAGLQNLVVQLAANTGYYFRVVGEDVGGFDLGMGTIQLFLSGTETSNGSITTPAGCVPIAITINTARFFGRVTCVLSNSGTFVVDWWAGVTG